MVLDGVQYGFALPAHDERLFATVHALTEHIHGGHDAARVQVFDHADSILQFLARDIRTREKADDTLRNDGDRHGDKLADK